MKKIVSILLSILITISSASISATAYTTDKPTEYSHTQEDSVKNDKLYISGYYVRDTKVWLWEDDLLFPECWYGIDENGEVYARDEYDYDAYDEEFLHEHDIEVYTIKDGEKKKVKAYDTDWDDVPWCTDLKPYTTYKFQLKISYYIGSYFDEDGNRHGVYKIHWSDPIKIRTCPKKTGVTYTKAARHTVRIRWKAVKCEGYKLQQYNAKKKKWVSIRTLPKSKTSAKIEGLKANSKYKFRVVPYGHVADKRYPREVNINKQGVVYTTSLFGKASKAVTVQTKK